MYPTIINYNFGPAKKSSEILPSIEGKLEEFGDSLLIEKRYLVKSKISWQDIDDLYIYRDIYIRKLACDACFKNYTLKKIKSKINSIINKTYC